MVAPPRTGKGPATTGRPAWHGPRPHSGRPRRRRHGPAGWGATPMGTLRHQRSGGTPQLSFCRLPGTPHSSTPTGPRPPCPRCVGRPHPVPHHTAPKTGDATARVNKQLRNTGLHYDIPTPNVIVTHNTGCGHYYLHATHERSPITIYTFTTHPGLQPPRHHPRPARKHPLHVAPTPRQRPAHHAPPPADSTALNAARRRAAAHHQNHLLPRISAGPSTVTEATHKSILNLLARKLRPKMALEDTLWISYGESRTARLADLRTIIPRHIQRAVGPFIVYAVPHPIMAQCTHCHPRCAQPCAGALQQPLPTPAYRGGTYLGTIPGDPHSFLLPAADRRHAIPLHLVEHLAVGPSPFQKRPPHTPSDGRPPDEPTHATPGPKPIALRTLKAEGTIP